MIDVACRTWCSPPCPSFLVIESFSMIECLPDIPAVGFCHSIRVGHKRSCGPAGAKGMNLVRDSGGMFVWACKHICCRCHMYPKGLLETGFSRLARSLQDLALSWHCSCILLVQETVLVTYFMHVLCSLDISVSGHLNLGRFRAPTEELHQ